VNCYDTLIKKILFKLDAEFAHHLSLQLLKLAYHLKLSCFFSPSPVSPQQLMGLSFPNSVGLAAGFDKNGDYIDALALLGFGFIEVGTVTPKPQFGNPKPRIFRIANKKAIINRLGFNNKGCDYVVERLKQRKFAGILGVNIGKNSETPLDDAISDYLAVFQKVAPFASYITVNISSPNTKGLRDLQNPDFLPLLLNALKKEQATQKNYVPLVVKIAPDLTSAELQTIAEIFLATQIDGVIATNTTITRPGIEDEKYAKEAGGLSGAPLTMRSTEVIKQLHSLLQKKIPIIASGGIMSGHDAQDKMAAGASLVQVYSGLIYSGPNIVQQCGTLA